jgi:hypothetical protein
MKLTGAEFLRRFCQHILPRGFVRIRHYGLLSASRKKKLKQLQNSLSVSVAEKRVKKDWKQICREHLGYDPDLCSECRQGKMVVIQRLDAIRGPPEKLWNPQVANRK